MKNYEKIGRVNGIEQLDNGRVIVDYTPPSASRGQMVFNNGQCFEDWLLGNWEDPYKPGDFDKD